jgi:hypothetical protein
MQPYYPFTLSFKGGIGRHAQGKLLNTPGSQCAWPQKASKIVLDLITNAESNAEVSACSDRSRTTHRPFHCPKWNGNHVGRN